MCNFVINTFNLLKHHGIPSSTQKILLRLMHVFVPHVSVEGQKKSVFKKPFCIQNIMRVFFFFFYIIRVFRFIRHFITEKIISVGMERQNPRTNGFRKV